MYHQVTCREESVKQFYVMGEKIGEGTFGIVRKAVRKDTGEEVAIKAMDKQKLDPEELTTMQLEVEILSQVDHPNIVKTYEIYDEPGFLYIVMEIMSGGELFDRVRAI
jgi:calcium/calmodulin-dependent protein kinase I